MYSPGGHTGPAIAKQKKAFIIFSTSVTPKNLSAENNVRCIENLCTQGHSSLYYLETGNKLYGQEES